VIWLTRRRFLLDPDVIIRFAGISEWLRGFERFLLLTVLDRLEAWVIAGGGVVALDRTLLELEACSETFEGARNPREPPLEWFLVTTPEPEEGCRYFDVDDLLSFGLVCSELALGGISVCGFWIIGKVGISSEEVDLDPYSRTKLVIVATDVFRARKFWPTSVWDGSGFQGVVWNLR
jgi:hypothetical protein